ncbi:MAG: Gfo/Idh/MocA family protein, partial [Candidatus Aenigmatarchaeota archaeon]
MRYGVIGVGYWGRKHVEELNEIGVVPYIADSDEGKLKELQEGISKWYDRPYELEGMTTDYRKLLEDSEIEAVSICTPNRTHYQICKEALEAGKHVFIEKPMTLDYKEALELVELAKEKDRFLAVGHIFRYDNTIRKARQLVSSGELGEVYTVSLRWLNYEEPWDRDIIFDLATHPFDIIHFIFGEHPDEINCIGEVYRKDEGEEAAFVNAKLGKMLVNMEMSWLTPEKTREVRITGSDKEAYIDCVNQEIHVYD